METLWRLKQFGVHFTFWTIPLPLCAEQGIVAGLSRCTVTWWLLPPAFTLPASDAWWDWSVVLRWLFILPATALLFAFGSSVSAACWSTFTPPTYPSRASLVFPSPMKNSLLDWPAWIQSVLSCKPPCLFVHHPTPSPSWVDHWISRPQAPLFSRCGSSIVLPAVNSFAAASSFLRRDWHVYRLARHLINALI